MIETKIGIPGLALAAMTLLLPGCGGVSSYDAGQQVSEAMCRQMVACGSTLLSESACVETGLNALPADAKDAISPCEQSEIDACVKESEDLPCGDTAATLPTVCDKC